MKIAFITPDLRLGGYEKVILNYANKFNELGHDVYILCGHARGELISEVRKTVHLLDFNSRVRYYIFPLVEFLRNNKDLDVLYSGFRSYNFISVVAKFFSKSSAKVVATTHGFERNSLVNSNLLLRTIINKADFKVAVSKAVAEYERESMNLNAVSVVYNPVIDERQVIEEQNHPWFKENIPILVNCGRLARDKHQDLAIRILHEVRKTMNVRLMLLGDGVEKENYEALANSLGESEAVAFIGYTDSPMSYMAHAKALLHLSEFEGFGNVIIEALYCDIPVFITDCGGPVEIIGNTKCGINLGNINEPYFVEKSAAYVVNFLKGNLKFKGMKKRARGFSIEEATKQIKELIQE